MRSIVVWVLWIGIGLICTSTVYSQNTSPPLSGYENITLSVSASVGSLTAPYTINITNDLGPTSIVVDFSASEVSLSTTYFALDNDTLNSLVSSQPQSAQINTPSTINYALSGSGNIPISILGKTCTMTEFSLQSSKPPCEPLRFTPSSSFQNLDPSTSYRGARLKVTVPPSSIVCVNGWCASALYYAVPEISPQNNLKDLGNGVVYDSIQGLMWHKGFLPHNYTYNEADNFTPINRAFHDCIDTKLAGYQDWRLPTRSELHRIMDHSIGKPALNSSVWEILNPTGVSSAALWTTIRTRVQDYFGVYFMIYGGDGGITYGPDTDYTKFQIAKCVRTVINKVPSTPWFVSAGTGSYTDTHSGLVWQTDYLHVEIPNKNTSGPAKAYCEGLTTDGHTDWRLPNNKEMVSFMDESRAGPAWNTTVFPSSADSNGWFWNSNNNIGFGTNYWWGWSGSDGVSYVNVSPGVARCVRGPDVSVVAGSLSSTPSAISNTAKNNDNQIQPASGTSSGMNDGGDGGSASRISNWIQNL